MSTAAEIIERSLLMIGAIASGETPTSDEQSDAFTAMKEMLDSWSNEHLIIPAATNEDVTLVANQQSYTMGSGGDFDTTRPMRIEQAIVRDATNFDLKIYNITQDEWAFNPLKQTTSELPLELYVEYTNPLATLYFWPKPSSARTVSLWSWKPLSAIATVSTELTFPPGYDRAIRFNLARELAGEYGKSLTPEQMEIARESKANIKIMNKKQILMGLDSGVVGRAKPYSILTGGYG